MPVKRQSSPASSVSPPSPSPSPKKLKSESASPSKKPKASSRGLTAQQKLIIVRKIWTSAKIDTEELAQEVCHLTTTYLTLDRLDAFTNRRSTQTQPLQSPQDSRGSLQRVESNVHTFRSCQSSIHASALGSSFSSFGSGLGVFVPDLYSSGFTPSRSCL
jgi:hypothetical protein